MMKLPRSIAPAAAVITVLLAMPVDAGGPAFWTIASHAEFLKGEPRGVSVDAAGRLVPSPAVTPLQDVAAPQVWSLLPMPDGTWVAGTGGDGRVVRGRAGGAAGDAQTVLDIAPNAVYALAASGARIFAAGSPDGQVHVIEPDGTSRVFFDPPEPHIWALTVDQESRLWVATGHPATIHRVAPDGTSTVVYRPPARHAVALAVDGAGRIFAGTDTPARLYRFDDGDRPFVVLESDLAEMKTIRPTPDGGLFAAAVTASGDPAEPTAVTGTVTITVGGAPAGSSSTTAPATPTGRRSRLYRVDAAGLWDALWETTDVAYDLAALDDTTALVATGPEGRLFQVGTDRTVRLIDAVDARQVTRLARAGATTLLATANPGRILQLGEAVTPAPPTFTSPVRDAGAAAQWGTLHWEGRGGITLQSRSGNTAVPDDSWSAWSAAYTTATGQPVTSPAARYLQWRATMAPADATAMLTSVTVSYLPRNTRPTVTDITVHPAGVVFQRPFSSDEGAIAGLDDDVAAARRPPGADAPPATALGRRMFQRGLRTFQWRAEDPDADRLAYALHYRREGDTAWHRLRAALADGLFVWDTTLIPDGRYVLRVTASDAPSNTPDRRLEATRETDAIDIDNTPPVVTVTLTGTQADVLVTDGHSAIQKVEYAIGGTGWTEVRPVDGLADAREERYVITLPAGAPAGPLVVRATDTQLNVTSLATARRP